jgi:hypothetical protein
MKALLRALLRWRRFIGRHRQATIAAMTTVMIAVKLFVPLIWQPRAIVLIFFIVVTPVAVAGLAEGTRFDP